MSLTITAFTVIASAVGACTTTVAAIAGAIPSGCASTSII